jgi:hypothetical protein
VVETINHRPIVDLVVGVLNLMRIVEAREDLHVQLCFLTR